jgi:pyruvate formate-lyase/glycerol dehydratase family glycyl radical enzyme
VQITLEGAIIFIRRYADLAGAMLQDCSPGRRQELEKMAGICENLATRGAGNFHEALQSLWFLFVLLHLESNASSFSPGRMDQYLQPYFEKDIAEGLLSEQDALELIESLWLKFNQIVYLRNAHSARYFAGFPIGFNVAIGGQTEAGEPAVNRLSWLMLKAQEHIGLPQPNLSARLAENTPGDFIEACARVIGRGSGMPQIFNDEAVITALVNQGIPRHEAMNYGIVGCVELSTHGNFLGWSDAAMFNMVKVLELTMFNGECQVTGRRTGPQTGYLSEHESYNDFERALEKQMDHFIGLTMKLCFHVEKMHAAHLPSPFLSSVINDCIEKGQDVTAGGATHNFSGIQFIQVANLADSLAVLKQEVFDSKRIGRETLMTAMKNNFEGFGELKIHLLEKVPKYGNDVKWVDEMGNAWAERFAKKISQFTNPRNGRCHTGFYTVSAHVPMGENVGATPDGRTGGTPLADGGLSAVYGRDLQGPTALLNSVSRINPVNGSNGALLNMKFTPGLFSNEQGIRKFSALLRSMLKLKIIHVQINVVDKEDLLRAQRQPELYRHLIVRVAGYSAYFTDLSTVIQDEIISRTTY